MQGGISNGVLLASFHFSEAILFLDNGRAD